MILTYAFDWRRSGTALRADGAPSVLRCGCVPCQERPRCVEALCLRAEAEEACECFGLGSAEHHRAVCRLGRHFTG